MNKWEKELILLSKDEDLGMQHMMMITKFKTARTFCAFFFFCNNGNLPIILMSNLLTKFSYLHKVYFSENHLTTDSEIKNGSWICCVNKKNFLTYLHDRMKSDLF